MLKLSSLHRVVCENPHCGKEFISNKPHAKTCSNACRQFMYRQRREIREEAKKRQMKLRGEENG